MRLYCITCARVFELNYGDYKPTPEDLKQIVLCPYCKSDKTIEFKGETEAKNESTN